MKEYSARIPRNTTLVFLEVKEYSTRIPWNTTIVFHEVMEYSNRIPWNTALVFHQSMEYKPYIPWTYIGWGYFKLGKLAEVMRWYDYRKELVPDALAVAWWLRSDGLWSVSALPSGLLICLKWA